MASTTRMNKKKKFVNDGLFQSELNEFFQRELAEDGYAGCELRQTPKRTDIVIKATSPTSIIGEKGRRINELMSLVQKRFGYEENKVELFVERVKAKGLCAVAQAEALKYKLLEGLAVRRAAYTVLRQVMNAGAKGCEVVISGKLRAARAKSMKFTDGFMIHSGQPTKDYIDRAVRHVMLRQGVLGVKVKIMLPHDPTSRGGTGKPLPDLVVVREPKDEGEPITEPRVENNVQFQHTTAPSEEHVPQNQEAAPVEVQTNFGAETEADAFNAPETAGPAGDVWG